MLKAGTVICKLVVQIDREWASASQVVEWLNIEFL